MSELLRFTEQVKKSLDAHDDLRIIITGVSGWLGRATLEMCDEFFGDTLSEKVVGVASRPLQMKLRSGRLFEAIDFKGSKELSMRPTLLAHYAFLTRDKVADHSLSDYVSHNRNITKETIALAQRSGVIGLFSTSSGAVYNKDKTLASDIEKNPYGVLKREEELALQLLSESEDISLSLARLFNLSGPFIHKDFALNSIIKSLLDENRVMIRAGHKVVRDYVHVQDLVCLGFAMAFDTKNLLKTSYDTGVGEPIEVGELADRVKNLLASSQALIDRPMITGEEDIYVGRSELIQTLFGSYEMTPKTLDEQILSTAAYISSQNLG